MPHRPGSSVSLPVAALVVLSGACGLVYQILWVRMLLPIFGTSAEAVATVLTAFMAGLALGAALFGRLVDRRGAGLRIYALLELGIAACALAFPLALARLDEIYNGLYRLCDGDPRSFAAARFLLSAALLVLPTTLMGGTLPALVRHIAAQRERAGRAAGALYALNTLGAVAGCGLVAFVLIERTGVHAANRLAAGVNVAVALVAWTLSRRTGDRAGEATATRLETVAAPPSALHRAIFWGYAVSGFAALGYEVVWTRVLSVILKITTTQSFATILVVYLTGLAAGSAAGARLVDRIRRLPAAFGGLELALGLAGALSIAAFGAVPLVARALERLPGWSGHAWRLVAAAAVVMALPTFLMGLLFPIAGKLHAMGRTGVGRPIGHVYAANTAGAIVGAFSAAFVLLPLAGSQRSLALFAGLNLVVGGLVLALDGSVSRRSRVTSVAAIGIPALALAVGLPSSFLTARFRSGPQTELVYHDEGAAGTVTVHRAPDGLQILRVNGAGEVPTDRASLRVFRLLGTLPLALHPDPDEVLVIAFGGGITLDSVDRMGPRSIDCVEIVPGVIEAARWFADVNGRVFDRVRGGRITLVFDDGRNHVSRTAKRYDVILSDSTHPATADSWVLYTEEFYRLCRARLATGGIFAQWLPIHGLTVDDYRMILRTFRTVFPHATLWHTPGYTVLLATPARLDVDATRLTERLASPEVRAPLEEVGLGSPTAILRTLALDEDAFERYAGRGPTNTDDRPYISFRDRTRAGATGQAIVASFEAFSPPRGGPPQ